MSTGYKIERDDSLYFVTFRIVGWVDIFTRQIYRDIAIDGLSYCQKHKGLNIFGYVIMSNHIHLLVQSEHSDLSGCIRDFKSYTSKKFREVMFTNVESRRDWMEMVFLYYGKYKEKQTYKIWAHDNHAEVIYSQKFIEQKLNYIHQNPVRNGLVANPEDYLYSSARNYAGLDSMLEVILLDRNWKTY